MLECGVYIGKDIEIVVTERFVMTFRRVKSRNALESCLLKKIDHLSHYSCVGICRSLPATTIAYPRPRKWQYALQGVKRKYHNNRFLAVWLGHAYPTIQEHEDRIELLFPDGDTHSAKKTEAFRVGDLDPVPPSISENNVGKCLQYWPMGCKEGIMNVGGNDACISVTINTREHMYIFQMLPHDFYCRAARYRTCNSGVVFNQNFRQRSGNLSETYMVEDNSIAGSELSVDQDSFGVCRIIDYEGLMRDHLTERERSVLCYRYGLNGFARKSQAAIAGLLGISRSHVSRLHSKALKTISSVIPKPPENNIYWTVSSYTDSRIILNGCQGDVYEWVKPAQ